MLFFPNDDKDKIFIIMKFLWSILRCCIWFSIILLCERWM